MKNKHKANEEEINLDQELALDDLGIKEGDWLYIRKIEKVKPQRKQPGELDQQDLRAGKGILAGEKGCGELELQSCCEAKAERGRRKEGGV